MADEPRVLPRFAVAAYAVALVFILTPLADVLANIGPLDLGNMQWRFGAYGITSNYLISVIFGMTAGTLVAAGSGHRRVLRVFAVLGIVGGAKLALASVLFALDVLQLTGQVRPEALTEFRIGAVKSEFKVVLSSVALLLVGVTGWRVARDMRAGDHRGAPTLVREG